MIRYYGGINLGTGGLVRAYAGTAKMALDNASIGEFIEQAEYQLTLNYKQIDGFKRDLTQLGGELIHAEFADVRSNGASVRDTTTNKERFTFDMRWRGQGGRP